MAIDWVSVAEARQRDGLRLVLVGGVPSPWGEAAKGILQVKGIPFCATRLAAERPAVIEWTGIDSGPIAVYEDEAPRAGWAEILLLAERLAPEPALVPDEPAERARMFGLAHEICGEEGLGWSRRLTGIVESLRTDGARGFAKPIAEFLAPKYGYRGDDGGAAHRRVVELLGLLANTLRESDSGTYLGGGLTALDLYSATFMALFAPLPPDQCPMPDALRRTFETSDPETEKALDPILLAHRDRIYREHLELPVEL